MTRVSRRSGLGAYARAIERAWSTVRGRPSLLSPRDFALAAGWHARGIPLSVVIEVFAELARPSRGRRRPAAMTARSLGYFAPAVEEAWQAIRGGRVAAPSEEETPDAEPGLLDPWRRVRDDAATPLALKILLESLLREVEAGGDRLAADRHLDEELPGAAPPAVAARAASQAVSVLEAARRRMTPETYRTTLRRAWVDRLRRALGLPRIGLVTVKR